MCLPGRTVVRRGGQRGGQDGGRHLIAGAILQRCRAPPRPRFWHGRCAPEAVETALAGAFHLAGQRIFFCFAKRKRPEKTEGSGEAKRRPRNHARRRPTPGLARCRDLRTGPGKGCPHRGGRIFCIAQPSQRARCSANRRAYVVRRGAFADSLLLDPRRQGIKVLIGHTDDFIFSENRSIELHRDRHNAVF